MENKQAFEERKTSALNAAHAQGIVDVVTAGNKDGISPETVELATRLMKKHRKVAYERIQARQESQK